MSDITSERNVKARPRSRIPTIRARVIALIAIVLVPLLGLFAWTALNYARAERQLIEVQRTDVVNNLNALVDREISGIRGALLGLGTSDELHAGQFADFARQATALATQPHFVAISVVDRRGQTVYATTASAELFSPGTNFTGKVFNGQMAVSSVTTLPGSNKPIVAVGVPVYRQSEVVYALIAAIETDRFQDLFAEANLQAKWLAAVVDRNGRFVTRSLEYASRVNTPASLAVQEVAKGDAEWGVFDNTTLEGVRVSNSFRRSSLSDWTSVMAVPLETLNSPMQNTMALVLIGGTLVSFLTLGLGSLMAASISEPVRSLSSVAAAVVEGRALPDFPQKIAELDEVRLAFEHAVAKSAHLSAIVASSGDAIMSIGLDGRIQSWNHGSEKLFGYSSAEAIGQLKRLVIPDANVAEFEKHLSMIRRGESLRADTVRQNRNGDLISVSLDMAPILSPSGKIVAISSIAHDITDRKAAQEHEHFLMREITHRSKNLLAIVQSMARQTARSSDTIDQFQAVFMQRVQGLSASHDLLVTENWVGAPLSELIQKHLQMFVQANRENLEISGPTVYVNANAAQALGLAMHELATNSVKYGALSSSAGKISVVWAYEPDGGTPRLALTWKETGGPPVKPPERKGFGHFVMERMAAQSLDGEVNIQFLPGGLVWKISMPASNIVNDPKSAVAATRASGVAASAA